MTLPPGAREHRLAAHAGRGLLQRAVGPARPVRAGHGLGVAAGPRAPRGVPHGVLPGLRRAAGRHPRAIRRGDAADAGARGRARGAATPGRHCHATTRARPLPVVGCHCLGIHTVILRSLESYGCHFQPKRQCRARLGAALRLAELGDRAGRRRLGERRARPHVRGFRKRGANLFVNMV